MSAAPAVMVADDATFEQRWSAWQIRGLAHERLVRRRLLGAVAALAAIAAAALLGYTLFLP